MSEKTSANPIRKDIRFKYVEQKDFWERRNTLDGAHRFGKWCVQERKRTMYGFDPSDGPTLKGKGRCSKNQMI
jgi:hypothetical protein